MRSLKIFPLLTFLSFVLAIPVFGQAQQSAIYDAIALMNAKQGINVILMPDAIGYHTIDPVTGKQGTQGQVQPLAAAFKDVAASRVLIIKVLARNAGLADTTPEQDVLAAYANNPFLKDILAAAPVAFAPGATLRDNLARFAVAPDAGLGATNIITNLANGTADFLIKRANDELSVAVIQRLKDFIGHYPEFNVLFPRTIALIKPVAAYDYGKTLNALKSALQQDLDQLPQRLPQLYGLPRYQQLNARVPVITMIFTASSMLDALNGKKGISRSIHDLDTCQFLSAENNYAGFIKVVALTSDNLRKKLLTDSEDADYPYISADEINKVTNNDIGNKAALAKYFLGLLYQRGQSIPFWTGTGKKTAGDLLTAWASSSNVNFADLLDQISAASVKVQELTARLADIKDFDQQSAQLSGKPFFSSERFEVYNQLVAASLKLCEPFITGTDANTPFKQEFIRISNDWPVFADHTVSMIKAITDKQYSLAVDDLGQMLGIVSTYVDSQEADPDLKKQAIAAVVAKAEADVTAITTDIKNIDTKLKALTTTRAASLPDQTAIYGQQEALIRQRTNLTALLKEANWQKDNAEKFAFTFTKVVEYYKLLAALSQAENGSEVESLLETYALPSGSSRIKKETNFNIALNAYVGGFFARSQTENAGFSNQYGLTAPIGFTISRGFSKAGSLSLLAGIFDVGGVIRYKLNEQGAYQQDVNLAGLVSPSVHAVYGLPFYLPLSVGAGCQWTTPVSTTSNNISLKPHFNLFIAVDIPLFNLVATRKKNAN